MSSENLTLLALCIALAAPALLILITGGSLGAAILGAILCLPVSAPLAAALTGAIAELTPPKR